MDPHTSHDAPRRRGFNNKAASFPAKSIYAIREKGGQVFDDLPTYSLDSTLVIREKVLESCKSVAPKAPPSYDRELSKGLHAKVAKPLSVQPKITGATIGAHDRCHQPFVLRPKVCNVQKAKMQQVCLTLSIGRKDPSRAARGHLRHAPKRLRPAAQCRQHHPQRR